MGPCSKKLFHLAIFFVNSCVELALHGSKLPKRLHSYRHNTPLQKKKKIVKCKEFYITRPPVSTLLWHDFENQFSIDNRLLVGAISGPIFQVGNSYTESCISSYLRPTTRRNGNRLQRSQYIFLFLNKICRRFIYNLGLLHQSRSNAVFWVPHWEHQPVF